MTETLQVGQGRGPVVAGNGAQGAPAVSIGAGAAGATRFAVCREAGAGEIPARFGVVDQLSSDVVEWHLDPGVAANRAAMGNVDPGLLGCAVAESDGGGWPPLVRDPWTGEMRPARCPAAAVPGGVSP